MNSKEQDGFCCKRFRKVVNSSQTSRKNCRKNSDDARESCWPRELVAKSDPARFLEELRVAFVGFLSYTKENYFTRKRGEGGFSHVRRSGSSLRNSFGIVTFLGGFQRHDGSYNRNNQRCDLRE